VNSQWQRWWLLVRYGAAVADPAVSARRGAQPWLGEGLAGPSVVMGRPLSVLVLRLFAEGPSLQPAHLKASDRHTLSNDFHRGSLCLHGGAPRAPQWNDRGGPRWGGVPAAAGAGALPGCSSPSHNSSATAPYGPKMRTSHSTPYLTKACQEGPQEGEIWAVSEGGSRAL
jgi:hypothetical protein